MDTLILSVHDLRRIVTHVGIDALMDEVIDRLERACREYDPARFTIPPRAGITTPTGLIEWMPLVEEGRQATVKLVGYHPRNPREGLPTILSIGLTIDTATGHLLALADATFATALRTGAASALASRVLASPDTRRLGIVGAGAQAVAQTHALSRLFHFDEVLIFDTNLAVSASFGARIAPLGLKNTRVIPAPLARVAEADIICTATSTPVGAAPVLEDRGLSPHVHVNAVGSDFSGKTELPLSLLKRSFVAVDFLPQACREGEAQRLDPREIGPDLVELLQGADQFAAYRSRPTVFDSTGYALEDHTVIEVLVHHAEAIGCGTRCQVESSSLDAMNPYGFLLEDGPGVSESLFDRGIAAPGLDAYDR